MQYSCSRYSLFKSRFEFLASRIHMVECKLIFAYIICFKPNKATKGSSIRNYKITKIVRALYVNMVVASRCRALCALITQCKSEFEKVFEFKTRQVYFIYPFLRRRKLGKSLQRRCVNCFSLKLTFYARKISILETDSYANPRLGLGFA